MARSNFRPAVVAGTCAEGRVVVEAGRCRQLVPTPRYKAPWPVAGPDSRGSRQVAHVAVVGNPAPEEAGKTGVGPAGSRSSWRPAKGLRRQQRQEWDEAHSDPERPRLPLIVNSALIPLSVLPGQRVFF